MTTSQCIRCAGRPVVVLMCPDMRSGSQCVRPPLRPTSLAQLHPPRAKTPNSPSRSKWVPGRVHAYGVHVSISVIDEQIDAGRRESEAQRGSTSRKLAQRSKTSSSVQRFSSLRLRSRAMGSIQVIRISGFQVGQGPRPARCRRGRPAQKPASLRNRHAIRIEVPHANCPFILCGQAAADHHPIVFRGNQRRPSSVNASCRMPSTPFHVATCCKPFGTSRSLTLPAASADARSIRPGKKRDSKLGQCTQVRFKGFVAFAVGHVPELQHSVADAEATVCPSGA